MDINTLAIISNKLITFLFLSVNFMNLSVKCSMEKLHIHRALLPLCRSLSHRHLKVKVLCLHP